MKIETSCKLKEFRKFLILSTCQTFIPRSFKLDGEVFPERHGREGGVIVEAKYKETVGSVREVTFVKAREVLKISYNSKSGRSKLTWTRTKGEEGKLVGEASMNTVVNLASAGILSGLNLLKGEIDKP
ncbi:TPA: hypothetical protein EYP26_06080 [Candidatus Bathyarchaeota archaeon]|nr:hypothetical protein [Candidatus Bathyarchaeota archaeon]